MSKEQFIREAFFLPPAVIEYHVSQSQSFFLRRHVLK